MKNYRFHPKLVLRNPLRTFKKSFSDNQLQKLYSEPEIREALFLSSPSLLAELKKWESGAFNSAKQIEKLKHSLLKYALRMHTRCTPFGLFAGCSVVDWGSETAISIQESTLQRCTRLDMNYTCALALKLAQNPLIKAKLHFRVNSSLYELEDEIRYVEYYYRNNQRVHQICAVPQSIYLKKILDCAADGATLNELAMALVDDEITKEEADLFVEEICKAQLIVSELDPSVSGEESLTAIIQVVEKRIKPHEKQLVDILSKLNTVKTAIEGLNQGDNTEQNYLEISKILDSLEVSYDLSKLFQTDIFRATQSQESAYGTLSDDMQKKLSKVISVLNRITPTYQAAELKEFKKEFYQRYEDREVPLAEALDNELGIGYGQNTNASGEINPLLQKLYFPYKSFEGISSRQVNVFSYHTILLRKLKEQQEKGLFKIDLSATDFPNEKENWDNLQDSMAVFFRHLGKRNGDDYLHLKSVGGTSATNLLGRFAFGHHEIKQMVQEICEREQALNPNAIMAEIVHLPESRTGNILMRPQSRSYEIPYLSRSTVPKEYQIDINDLMVSVKRDRIILRSKKWNKEVLPRLGNAHNYRQNALPVYHFLCDLQVKEQVRSGVHFSWGFLQDEFKFLPRVEIEGVVVSLAVWHLTKADYEELFSVETKKIAVVEEWRKKWKLPTTVLLADGDNELLIDLTNSQSTEMFIELVRKRDGIQLKEYLFDPSFGVVKNNRSETFTNEFVAVLLKELPINSKSKTHNKSVAVTKQEKPTIIQRTFSIGSEWLYFKLYCGMKTQDGLLEEVIGPLAEQLIQSKQIDKWFFIRYHDPNSHLRVRFHFSDLANIGGVIETWNTVLNQSQYKHKIYKIQADTYNRELERYGNETITDAETLFSIDSSTTAKMLTFIEGAEGEKIRWLFAIRSIDELLNSFRYEITDKFNLFEQLKTSFNHEFAADKQLKKQIDKRFREYSDEIQEIMLKELPPEHELYPIWELILQRKEQERAVAQRILDKLKQKNDAIISHDDLLSSYIHMHMNRLFINRQRQVELVIYEFMWKIYKSQVARSAKEKKIKKLIPAPIGFGV